MQLQWKEQTSWSVKTNEINENDQPGTRKAFFSWKSFRLHLSWPSLKCFRKVNAALNCACSKHRAIGKAYWDWLNMCKKIHCDKVSGQANKAPLETKASMKLKFLFTAKHLHSHSAPSNQTKKEVLHKCLPQNWFHDKCWWAFSLISYKTKKWCGPQPYSRFNMLLTHIKPSSEAVELSSLIKLYINTDGPLRNVRSHSKCISWAGTILWLLMNTRFNIQFNDATKHFVLL